MFKITKVLNTSLGSKKLGVLKNKLIDRSIHDFNFNSEEEIIVNSLDQIILIGINLPDTKNLITETAVKKLDDCFKNFEHSDKYSVAILHGCGGNFCSGLVSTKEAVILSQNLIKTLHISKKPILGALDGYTTNFGFHLAIMCDMRVMDEAGVVGINDEAQNLEISPVMCERLILNIGLARTIELICSRRLWPASKCLDSGLITRLVDPGCALGQAICWAQSIAFNNSLKDIILDKSKILSCLKAKVLRASRTA